ncbi:MAG TPA: HAMP domain-containing sensor histidine kinase [Dehalococcoidia bacterium]|nr:HAMP domain-containing sensor histidine kinase [Dehalococcoidia bacterium]
MSLRLRLALSYILFLVPALIVFSAAVYFIASSRIYGALDDSVLGHVDSVAAETAEQPLTDTDALRQNLGALDAASGSEFEFKVSGTDGHVLYASSRTAVTGLPDISAMKDGPSHPITWGPEGRQMRVAFEPFPSVDSPQAYIFGAVSLKQTDAAIEELRGVFVVGAILVVLLTGAPAYYLAGRSLAPVREVANRAASIERSGDFASGLEPPGRDDEIAELVRTFNAMVERVRNMLVVQRDFLAHSSHELRRPLTVIGTYIDFLGYSGVPDAERESALKTMRAEIQSMSRLITDLLVLSREEEAARPKSPVDMAALAEEVFTRYRKSEATHRLGLRTCNAAMVLGDAEGLQHMFANLLDNAIEYTPEGGTVDVAVERQNGAIRVSIKDSGIGIPESERDRVFDRFFRGKRALETRRDGSGLGLVIVRQIAESHGGHTSFESSEGMGSTFTVELPALKDA